MRNYAKTGSKPGKPGYRTSSMIKGIANLKNKRSKSGKLKLSKRKFSDNIDFGSKTNNF